MLLYAEMILYEGNTTTARMREALVASKIVPAKGEVKDDFQNQTGVGNFEFMYTKCFLFRYCLYTVLPAVLLVCHAYVYRW